MRVGLKGEPRFSRFESTDDFCFHCFFSAFLLSEKALDDSRQLLEKLDEQKEASWSAGLAWLADLCI